MPAQNCTNYRFTSGTKKKKERNKKKRKIANSDDVTDICVQELKRENWWCSLGVRDGITLFSVNQSHTNQLHELMYVEVSSYCFSKTCLAEAVTQHEKKMQWLALPAYE